MPDKPGCHLDYDDRRVIEEGLEAGFSASRIARRIGVSPSTVTREVKANRYGRPSKSKEVKPARKCAYYDECRHARDVCAQCAQEGPRRACRRCSLVACADLCPDFEPRVCELLERWPYLCRCDRARRNKCDLPKFRYDARRAQEAADERLSRSRAGISISEQELADLLDRVLPLIRMDVPAIYLPRKVRYRPRKKGPKAAARLEGREYADFLALDPSLQARAVEMDSVLGRESNTARILSLHFVRCAFQFYLRLEDGSGRSVKEGLDMLERALGSPEAFRAVFGILLTDRGEEFRRFEPLEQSCLVEGRERCRVYFCDPLRPGQKGRCERNHEELRRILPKGRSDFDLLTGRDLAVAASHVDSYPRASLLGRCPVDVAASFLPDGFLDLIGVEKLPLEEVVLRPSLLAHAVIQ